MRRRFALAPVVLLLLAAGACDGHDGKDTATDNSGDQASTATAPVPEDSTSAANPGLTVTDGTTPADLLTCLTTGGLQAAADDSTPLGVDDPVVEIRVEQMLGYDGTPSQGAYLWVFADPAAATKNASVLTLGGTDDPGNNRYGIAGNVVRELDIITTSTPTADESALLGCLPG